MRKANICILVLGSTLLGGCFGKKHEAPVAGTSAEPDKVLYERAVNDFKHGKYTVGRLGMQTLINTYPDSEYLAKAKLAIGDSFYKEGGTAGLKQSIVEYKDFITFFPFLDEAATAQYQIAMAHYRQMEKPDRDHAEAVQTEAEFQTFLEKYPSNSLVSQAEQRLRETQEVLAEGNFRVARFYYIRGGYKAAGARLLELTNRYPLYSQADQANWMLAQIYEKTEHNDIAARYYSQIVKEYPLSPLANDAKNKLTKFGTPVPPADPAAVARMQKDQASAEHAGLLGRSFEKPMEMLKSKPDVSAAARVGTPTMTPASESGDETLSFGPQPTPSVGVSAGGGNSATVETVTPGSVDATAQPAANSTDSSATSSDSSQPTSSDANSTTQPASTTTQPASTTTPAQPADTSQESTSKKKKGIHKILPF